MRSLANASLAGIALFATCAAVAPSSAPSPSPPASMAPAAGPSSTPIPRAVLDTPEYRVVTDEFVRKGNGDFTMPHKVTFSRPGSDGTAERAEGNTERGTVSLYGSVVVHDNGNAPEASSQDDYAKGGPSVLTCDRLDVDSKTKIYTAIGHVHFEQGARVADADHGVLNRKTGMLRLDGHVKTKENESTMTAVTMDYNLTTKRIEAVGKPIVIKQPVPTPEPGSVTPSPKPKKRRIPF